MKRTYLIGASTAGHQVEGNNIHSDFWAMEQMEHSTFKEPSLDCVDHYNRYKEDIDLMKNAGLNTYRFSIEWARIEPEKNKFDINEINHYKDMILYCRQNGIEPVITLHHFASPKWLIVEGGWEAESTIEYFGRYTKYVIEHLGSLLKYVCTINEANMGLQLAHIIKDRMAAMSNAQVGFQLPVEFFKAGEEAKKVFGGVADVNHFLNQRTEKGDEIISRCHVKAREVIKSIHPEIQVGITFSLHDLQVLPGGEELAKTEWDEELLHYLPYIKDDDFVGVQNYTRKILGPNGKIKTDPDAEMTDMGYEFYPQALENIIRSVYRDTKLPIFITENGISTKDDNQRVRFIEIALKGVDACVTDGIPIIGYAHWSLLDNFEWMLGYAQRFGLIAVDRKTQKRYPKPSLEVLGSYNK